jgi:dihydrofolate synthase / folylpolyglutamate synthase
MAMPVNANTKSGDKSPHSKQPALRFLAERINYERTQSMPCSEEAFKLDRMRDLLRRLGDPQDGIPIVHVAGTKGKGSTAAMMAAVLSAAGYRTGLFTSPHLDRVEERIAIDGQPCSEEAFAELIELVRPIVEAMDREGEKGTGTICRNGPQGAVHKLDLSPFPPLGPTYFEIVTAAALCHFARCGVNAAVLEVGLGGRLDSTNVCTPWVTVITSISFDHVKQLGDTLAAIAAEKAGIVKPGVPVISGVADEEPRVVVRQIASQNGCRLLEMGVDFDFDYHPPQHLERALSPARFDFRYLALGHLDLNNIALGLLGRHQAANAALVLAVVEELRRNGWTIPEAAVRRGLAEVAWPARVEVVARRPTVVLDAAHNAASIKALVQVLAESFSVRRRLLIFATTQEKDLRGMLKRLLGRFDHVIFTRYLSNPRSVAPEQLQELALELAGQWGGSSTVTPTSAASVEIAPTPAEAWDAVHRLAGPDDLICITGSFFLAAEMRRQLAARPLS